MIAAPVGLVAARRGGLRSHLDALAIDALLVSARPNIRYLSNFAGSSAWLLATAEDLTLISDARYAAELDALAAELPGLRVEMSAPGGSLEEQVASVLAARGPLALGFESQSLTVAQHRALIRLAEERGGRVEWIATAEVVEQLREVKDPWELATLREAGRRLSDVAKCIIPNALAGVPERELATRLEWELRQKGFDKPAFDTIVASGPNAALPHHRAGERRLEAGDLVVVDFGGVFRGYAVDMTRTVTIGRPTARQDACWHAVAAAQRAAFEMARVGVATEDVDAAARRVLGTAGMGDAFTHGVGHGLGLEVHERPRLSRRRSGVPGGAIAAGMVFTLEPGVYFPGWGGVRIEDDVVATERGPEWLTDPVGEVRAT